MFDYRYGRHRYDAVIDTHKGSPATLLAVANINRKELQDKGVRQVLQAITGTITSLIVPEVQATEYIDINISYNAYNPNGSFWNWWEIYLAAKDNLGNKELVKHATVMSDRFSDSGSWRLWKMPGQSIILEIRLYGHDEVVPWDWSWWP